MRKEITPEMYNYNKYPGPQFVRVENEVRADQIRFDLLMEEKDAFQVQAFSQRFSEILLKYDYIVGDWGNDQLRLRGFYQDREDTKKSSRISRLEDYLKEFCHFGCAYFVLANPQPELIVFEEEKWTPKRRHSQKSGRQSEQSRKTRQNRQSGKGKSKANKAPKDQTKEQGKSSHFVIRQKEK